MTRPARFLLAALWAHAAMWAQTAAAALPAVGAPAPDFALQSSTGRNLRLSELRGEVVLINFWATWCGPCRQEMPQLGRLYAQYREAGFTLLGINIDDSRANAEAMMKKLGVGFPTLFDGDKRVARLYDVDTMPATLLIDRDGRVRYVHRGYRDGYERKYQEQIRELLKE
jgi:peroxiredoxin